MEPEPTYPAVVSSTDLPPWSGPFPYRSVQDPFYDLPMFRLPVMPAEWDGYRRWLRLADPITDKIKDRKANKKKPKSKRKNSPAYHRKLWYHRGLQRTRNQGGDDLLEEQSC
jgi:hypothetical protein